MLLAGLVGEVVAMPAAEVLTAPKVQLQDSPVTGHPVFDQRADEPPPFTPITARGGCKADGVIQVLLFAAMSLRLGVLEADFARPFLD